MKFLFPFFHLFGELFIILMLLQNNEIGYQFFIEKHVNGIGKFGPVRETNSGRSKIWDQTKYLPSL